MILVSHPHAAAVAVETAAACARYGRLARFDTGIAAAPGSTRSSLLHFGAARWPVLRNRLLTGIESRHLRSLASVELTARLVGKLAGLVPSIQFRTYDALFTMHDAAVACLSWPAETSAVYAYEDGAVQTFRRARKQDCRTILDLPLPWWRTIGELWSDESRRWPGAMGIKPPSEPNWKRRRKDAELGMADVVSVASAFTRESLEQIGIDCPIVTTPYPFPVGAFKAKATRPTGPFTVLAVGTHDLRKGTPYLLEAWRAAGLRDARLKLIGPMKLTPSFLAQYQGIFEHVPALPKVLLEPEYQAADLLAFPTLGDGFGLVIQEAMCCATPVMTTRCGGGPECITSGTEGLLVKERSVEALVEALQWAAANREALHAMGRAARRRAEGYTSTEFASKLESGLSKVVR